MKTLFRHDFGRLSLLLPAVCIVATSGCKKETQEKPSTASASAQSTKPAADSSDKPAAELKDDKEKASYAIGMYFGNQIKRGGLEVDTNIVVSGMKDVLNGGSTRLSETQAREAIGAYQKAAQAKTAEKAKESAEKNKKTGQEFLAANKQKPGVKTKEVTLPDGKTAELQYKVITEGTGETPKSTDTVRVNYRGTLINGKEFDSNTKHGSEPAEFPVTAVVKGWTEVLEMMKVGSKWEVYLPAELAYGDRAAGPDIEPGSTLVFQIELVGIKPPPPPPPPAQPLTSDIIKVPSAEELQKGEKIQVLKPEEVEKLKKEEAEKQQQQQPKDKTP